MWKKACAFAVIGLLFAGTVTAAYFVGRLPDMLFFVFVMAGGCGALCISANLFINKTERKQRCTYCLNAECVDYKSGSDADGKTIYISIWRYIYNGSEYTVDESSYKDKRHEIGMVKDVFINPNNPREHYDDVVSRDISFVVIAVIGVVFTYIGAAGIFFG